MRGLGARDRTSRRDTNYDVRYMGSEYLSIPRTSSRPIAVVGIPPAMEVQPPSAGLLSVVVENKVVISPAPHLSVSPVSFFSTQLARTQGR